MRATNLYHDDSIRNRAKRCCNNFNVNSNAHDVAFLRTKIIIIFRHIQFSSTFSIVLFSVIWHLSFVRSLPSICTFPVQRFKRTAIGRKYILENCLACLARRSRNSRTHSNRISMWRSMINTCYLFCCYHYYLRLYLYHFSYPFRTSGGWQSAGARGVRRCHRQRL